MSLLVDTGVFSAIISPRRRVGLEPLTARVTGRRLFLAVQTVAELRYGALVAGWGDARRARLEAAIANTGIVPVTNELLDTVARLRFACRNVGHAVADPAHHEDLWIAATAMHAQLPLLSADRIFTNVPGLTLA